MAIFHFNKASDKDTSHLAHVVCQYCDLLLDDVHIPPHYDLTCPRCQAKLYHNRADTLDREYALVLTGLMLFAPAMFLPIMKITPFGQLIEVSLFDGVLICLKQNDPIVAGIIFLCAVAAPFLSLFLLFLTLSSIYIQKMKETAIGKILLKQNIAVIIRRESVGTIQDYGVMFFRWYKEVNQFAMLEVYLLGFMVTFTNVGKMGSFIQAYPSWGFYAFIGVMLTIVLSGLTLNSQLVWQKLDKRNNEEGVK